MGEQTYEPTAPSIAIIDNSLDQLPQAATAPPRDLAHECLCQWCLLPPRYLVNNALRNGCKNFLKLVIMLSVMVGLAAAVVSCICAIGWGWNSDLKNYKLACCVVSCRTLKKSRPSDNRYSRCASGKYDLTVYDNPANGKKCRSLVGSEAKVKFTIRNWHANREILEDDMEGKECWVNMRKFIKWTE